MEVRLVDLALEYRSKGALGHRDGVLFRNGHHRIWLKIVVDVVGGEYGGTEGPLILAESVNADL